MLGKKAGKWSSKRIQIVTSKAKFDAIDATREELQDHPKQSKKSEIITPSFSTVKPICPPKNKAIPLSYVKTISVRSIMRQEDYELDTTDLCFLHSKL
jgi:hypothetical protein